MQQASIKDRFCVFCGFDLESRTEDGNGAASAAQPGSVTIPEDESAPEHYTGPRYCPNGHDVQHPWIGFCEYCGLPLVDTPQAAQPAPPEPGRGAGQAGSSPEHKKQPDTMGLVKDEAPAIRKCSSCGFLCEDPLLACCPNCGMSLNEPEAAAEKTWTCTCGTVNPMEMQFCSECGSQRNRLSVDRPAEPEPVAPPRETPTKPVVIPQGMRPLGETDLMPKPTHNY